MKWYRILFFSLFTLGCLLVIRPGRSGNVSAQSASATLSGEVVDEQGAAIPGVKITALNVATSLRRRAVTNEDGGFTIPLLPPGVYTLVALRDGFTPIEIRQVELNINDNRALRIALKVGAITDSVIIVGTINQAGTKNGALSVSANRIDLSTATLKYTITNEQVSRAPSAARATGRNPLALLPFLAPGVSPTETTGTARGNNLDGAAMSVNGARPRSNSFSFQDGDNNEVEANSALSPLPNPDALQEITVLTNSYPADEGRGIGGVVNAVMKSGGAEWHANLRYIGVNEALAARSFFDQQKGVNRLHTFGGQVSGPVSLPGLYSGRDRTFFFFDYEGARWLQKRKWGHLFLFRDEERTGDFSRRPENSRPVDPLTGLPFPGGLIPPDRINPISRAILERFVPRTNIRSNRNFTTTLPYHLANNAVAFRADHQAGQADSVNFTLFFNSPETVNSSKVLDPTKIPINFQSFSRNSSWNAALGETHIISPRAINQFTAAIARLSRIRKNYAPGVIGVAPSDFGFTGINPQSEKYLALPSIVIRGFGIVIDPTEDEGESAYTTWQIKDDLSYDFGAHQIKIGGDLRRFALNLSTANNNGSFEFPDMAQFLLGLPIQFEQNSGSNMNLRQTSLYLYGMDNWRVRPNLTFHLGLRYELALPLKDELSHTLAFRPGQQSQRIPYAPAGLLFAGDSDPIFGVVPSGIYPADKNNLAPRIGLAYSPRGAAGWRRRLLGEGKTAIRAAWGVFYDAALGGAYTRVGRNPPFSVSLSSSGAELGQRGGTFANPYGVMPNPFPIDSTHPVFDTLITPNVTPFDPKFRTAYSYQYNLTIQRELPWELFLQLAYVGSNTFKQHRERELNLVRLDPDHLPDDIREARLYPRLGSIWNQESAGRARYDALQMSLERRFGNQLSFGVSYVLSKTLDNSSRAIDASNDPSNDASNDAPTPYPERWGRSDFDRRRNFVLYYLYDLPKPRIAGKLAGLLGGWQFGGVAQLRSGQPLQILQELDPLYRQANCCETVAGIPDLVGPFRRYNPRRVRTLMTPLWGPGAGNFFFDPAAFRYVEDDLSQMRSGTLGRNLFDGPGIVQLDATLIKQIKLREKHVFEIRADINNLLNHALFENPHTRLDDPAFGQVTSAGPGRMIQFSLRYSF